MGVPKFYRWISERYPCLSSTVKELQIPEFDNLYLDMNGIIHVCSHPDDNNPHFRITIEKILTDICHYIEFLYRIIKPRKVFFMAVDGVAPRAKMNQQRGRRFRSAREAEEHEKKAREKGEVLPTEKRFDSNCITPGTEFMVTLQEHLKYFVTHKVSTDPLWQGTRIYLSGHETPGEGEHKIMDFIRQERTKPDYDSNTRHCLYGLDADLMMLGLATHEPHFSLLREEVRFGGKKDSQRRPATPEETTFHLLHLSLFREYLDFEFKDLKNQLPFGYDLEKIIDDWVLMGFLVGNDFIPNLPHLHIRHDALPLLWKSYMNILPECGGYLNEGGHLNLVRFEKYLEELKKFDIERFEDMYADFKWLEGKKGGTNEAPPAKPKKLVNHSNRFKAFGENDDEMGDEILFGAGPGSSGEQTSPSDEDSEDYDTFDEEFRQHKRNYYQTKMEFEHVTPEVLRDQAEGYVRAIQWILLYYYEGVPSWSWFYPHHYAPYISDIINFSQKEIKFELGTPFLPFQQLMAVLPALSKDLLPEAYQPLMLNDTSPIIDFYPVNFETDLNDKQQEWEAVVLIPFIEENRLLTAMGDVENRLTDREKARNKHGPCLMYMYTEVNQGPYTSHQPSVFPDIGFNYSFITEFYLEDFYVPDGQLKKGLLPGVKLDVYYPGFPTLKHIPHTAHLKKANVKVFQMNSKNENMILQILGSDEDRVRQRELDDIAKEYIDQIVYVGWPHLYQAKVVAVFDDESKCVSTAFNTDNKKVKGPQFVRDPLKDDERSLFHREVDSITVKYHDRLGVDVGPTFFMIKALPMTGKKYECGSHGRVILEKQFDILPVSFVLQASVKDIAVHDPTYQEFSTLGELFPAKQPIFMIGSPHYGCQGEVLEVDESESPRVRVSVTIIDEPVFQMIESRPEYFKQKYYPGYTLAQRLGISSHFLSRITGSIFIKKGSPESSEGSANIGLNLKFTKRNEQVPGYTKMGDNGWTYSQKAMDTIDDYLKKFPELWETILKQQDNKTDNFYESDIFNGNGFTLGDVSDYLKTLPCTKIKTMKVGADILDEGIIQAIEIECSKVGEVNRKKQKRVKMQVKPHLLFRPIPNESTIQPDPTASFYLFDRVVNVRQGFSVPFGLRGTVVGIHKAEKAIDTMYEVIFDAEFTGGINIRCTGNRGYRVPATSMINMSHGDRKCNGNKSASQNREKMAQGNSANSNSQGQSRNYNRNAVANGNMSNRKSGHGASNDYNDTYRNMVTGGYMGPQQGYGGKRQEPFFNGHMTENRSHDNKYGRQGNQHQSLRDNSRTNKTDSVAPKLIMRQESFDENQRDVPLQFVTPKVVSPGRSQKPQDSRAMAAKMFQESNNSEFADIWNQLQTVSPNIKPSINNATQALDKLPANPDFNQPKTTALDVQSLFAVASQSSVEELSNKLKDLQVDSANIEDGVVVCSSKKQEMDKEESSAALKQILMINSDKKEETPQTKENPSYGRQVSVQELFDGVKQTSTVNPPVQSSSLDQLHQTQGQKHPVESSSDPSQSTQHKRQQQTPGNHSNHGNHGNQGRPKSGSFQNRQTPGPPRNPVMQLMHFCKSMNYGEPKYEFNGQGGSCICFIYLSNGQRFKGAQTKTQEAAAESAASAALHQLLAQFQPSTACHPLMMMQQGMMPPPPWMMPPSHMMHQRPQNRQSNSQPFPSAFRPVQPQGGQNMHNYDMGPGVNHGNYNRHQRPQHHQDNRQRQNRPYREQHSVETHDNRSQGSAVTYDDRPQQLLGQGEKSPTKQSHSNPFIPLQVTQKQKTPQKKRDSKEENNSAMDISLQNPSTVITSPHQTSQHMDKMSPGKIVKGDNQTDKNGGERTPTKQKSGSGAEKKTPPKQQTPGKKKSRLAANFGGMK